ncbi:2-hydroxyacyl-CoA dehydratase [Dyella sp.]|uniref:2-hydroxyacyl-CoA dehydratase n=2 Tax=Dyella sp. TaxID=1869338 RepID=UPI002D773DFD|nr:2-hydroxyacyl-CoA dehydratase [Dyella sp.]HET7332806.1 2-hydroxyacyl-CoA dehydratase [Dyella sp.]
MDGAHGYEIIRGPAAHPVPMTLPKDAFRRFQEELAALDKEIEQRAPKPRKPTAKQAAMSAMESAREEFLALRARHNLTVADVVAFFPEEEGIAYLQSLIAQTQAKPRRGRKPKPKDGSA